MAMNRVPVTVKKAGPDESVSGLATCAIHTHALRLSGVTQDGRCWVFADFVAAVHPEGLENPEEVSYPVCGAHLADVVTHLLKQADDLMGVTEDAEGVEGVSS